MLFLEGNLITLHPVPMKFTIVKKAVAMGPRSGGGVLVNFQYKGVCVHFWGPESHVKSIFVVCE